MLHLAQRLVLNGPHPFACYSEDASDFFQRVGKSVSYAVSQLDDLSLPVCQALQKNLDSIAKFCSFQCSSCSRLISFAIFSNIVHCHPPTDTPPERHYHPRGVRSLVGSPIGEWNFGH